MPDGIVIPNPWGDPPATTSSSSGSSGGSYSYSPPATYSGSQTDYDGSVTGTPGTIYQMGPTGAIGIIYRPSTPSSVSRDLNNDGLDDSTGRAVGVQQVSTSVSPTGYVYGSTPVWPDGSPYIAPTGSAARDYSGTLTTLPDGRVVLLDPRTGAIIEDYGAKPSATTTQQFGSGSSSGGGGGGGGVATVSSEQKIREYEAQTAARIAQANAEADAAIRVAQARAQAGDAGDAGAMQRLQAQLAAQATEAAANRQMSNEQFQATFGLTLQQFAEAQRKNRVEEALALANGLQNAVSSTDPAAFGAWMMGGGGNIANALQAGPGGAVSDLANLPAARILQQIQELQSGAQMGTGGLGGAQAGGGVGTGGTGTATGGLGAAQGGEAAVPATPEVPALAATEGLGAPPEGFATWKDWAAQRYGDLGDISGQMLVDPASAQLSRQGRVSLADLIVNPELAALGQGGVPGNLVTIDSAQSREDYLNRLAYQQYLKDSSPRATANPYPTANTSRMWGLIAQDMAAYNGTGGPGPATPRPSTVADLAAAAAAPAGPSIAPGDPGGSIATAYNPDGVAWAGPGTGLVVPPERRAQGGPTRAPMMMTGDANRRDPFAGGARPELILNPTGAPIDVVPAPQVRQMMQGRNAMPQMRQDGIPRGLAMAQRLRGGPLRMMRQPGLGNAQIPRFADGTLLGSEEERRRARNGGIAPAPIAPAPAPTTTPTAVTPAPAPAPQPIATIPTESQTTVTTSAGPVATSGTIPTTTTVAPPTPVGEGGGLAAAQQPAPVPAPQPQTATTPTTTTVPQPVQPTSNGITEAQRMAQAAPVPATAGTTGGLGAVQDAMGTAVTAADRPYLDQIGDFRADVELPAGVSLYDTAWENIDPTIREMYLRGLQSKYGIPFASSVFEQQKYALPGASRAGLGLGY